ncbi:DUF2849 domain-containing protein [Breoghania sp.]|uniref:DUF2849 domain-containing protein n=1 Tax=Breoghania sp. TaxID=2065378 RepID=UPI0026263559|nr:DUF2849 domain-containing protein [Breoghania sp.]MDJ0930079.1 DUF2849 domain-containing protein [Breoghania sp.]
MQIVTANRLSDGDLVWLGANDAWVTRIDGTRVLEDPASVEAAAARSVAANEVIDVDTIDVTREGARIVPVRLRERIRATGPTFRTNLGKQAIKASDVA